MLSAICWKIVILFAFTEALFAQLQGVVDLHVHSYPDRIPRSIDSIEVARLAKRHGQRALLFKNHFTQTASTAYLVRQAVPGIEVYGGVVLNSAVGGINPAAVESMARLAPPFGRVVWMPTFDAENHRRKHGLGPPYVSVSSGGELLPEVKDVLALIARENLALATGHSSPKECLMLIAEARKAGTDRIIVTHAMLDPVRMSIEMQKEAAALGAFLEFPYNLLLPTHGNLPIETVAEAIHKVGPQHVILSSDLGQAATPVHTAGLLDYFAIWVCTSLPTTPHLVVGRSACRVGVGPSLNRSWAQRSRPVVQAGRRAFPGDESVVD